MKSIDKKNNSGLEFPTCGYGGGGGLGDGVEKSSSKRRLGPIQETVLTIVLIVIMVIVLDWLGVWGWIEG